MTKRAVWIVGVFLFVNFAPLVSAQQTLSLAPGERYLLVPNGAKRTTDGAGGARISIENRQVIRIDAAGEIEIRDARDQVQAQGRFLRWQGLSAGRIEVRSGERRAVGQSGSAHGAVRRYLRTPNGSQALIYR